MAKEFSFDIVSKVDLQEVDNAVNQVIKEINQRFDLKGTNSTIEWDRKENIKINAPDETKLKNIYAILQEKFVKRNISLKSLKPNKIENSLGGNVKQEIKIVQGIDKELAKKIITIIKSSKIKVNSQIQDEQIRVSGKDKDDLQSVIKLLKGQDFDVDLQFVNYR
jgi:hypothetical protein